jgi:hypothetical protein
MVSIDSFIGPAADEDSIDSFIGPDAGSADADGNDTRASAVTMPAPSIRSLIFKGTTFLVFDQLRAN